MTAASTAQDMSPKLLEVMERAKRSPQMRFSSLAHLIDEEALKRAYHRIGKDAAVGVDGVTKEHYGEALERNVADLHGRMKAMRYRHQPVRRVHIPKDQGKTRPIAISSVEDKSSRARSGTCSRPCTSRSSVIGRMASAADAAHTMRCAPWTKCWTRGK